MADSTDDAARAFYELSKRMKRLGQGELRKQFHKDIQAAAKPLVPAVQRQAEARFPSRGGLNRKMAQKSRYKTQARTGLSTAGVRIIAPRTDPRVDRRGRVQHPIFGRKGKPDEGKTNTGITWVPNAVGYFSETLEDRGDLVRDELVSKLTRWALENLGGDL